MSIEIAGKKCVVCGAYLFEDDDLVFCPDCAAPHHRDCYNSVGHCGLEQLHGTPQQYDKTLKREEPEKAEEIKIAYHTEKPREENPGEVKCGMCGEVYPSGSRACPKCGTPNIVGMGGYAEFDFLGGVPGDADLGDGVTANEAKNFVFTNTRRYIPKFAAMAAGVKASWNWAAFLFPGVWLLSRKMYKPGILVSALVIAFSMLTLPLNQAVYNHVDMTAAKTNVQLAEMIAERLPEIGVAVIIAAFLGVILDLILRIIVAAKADGIYKNHTLSSILEIKKESDDIDADYRRFGGVSFWAAVAGFAATQYLPAIIASFALI